MGEKTFNSHLPNDFQKSERPRNLDFVRGEVFLNGVSDKLALPLKGVPSESESALVNSAFSSEGNVDPLEKKGGRKPGT